MLNEMGGGIFNADTDVSLESNCSMMGNMSPPKVGFSDFIFIFVMSVVGFSCLILQH